MAIIFTTGSYQGTIETDVSGNLHITTHENSGSIILGELQEFSGSAIRTLDPATKKVIEEKKRMPDGKVQRTKFDPTKAGEFVIDQKVKDPEDGVEFIRSGSSAVNQIMMQQNSSGAFISVSGSSPGFNVINTSNNVKRLIRATYDFVLNPSVQYWNQGINADGEYCWSQTSMFSLNNPKAWITQTGDFHIKGNLYAQQYIVSSSVTHMTQSFRSGSTMFGDSVDDTHKFTGDVTASGNISASGTLISNEIDTKGNITASGDLVLHSDGNNFIYVGNTEEDSARGIYFKNENNMFSFGINDSGGGNAGLYFDSRSYDFASANETPPLYMSNNGRISLGTTETPSTFTVEGDISSSGYISASGDIHSNDVYATSGSFTYITASHIDTDDNSISIGGERITKTDWRNVKQGKFSDVSGTGDITISGSLLPSVDNNKGFTLGSKSKRWARIFLASTIDVSGSSLVISPSASAAAGDDFNVIVSGSILPADSGSDSIGSAAAPFADLYVTTASIKFVKDGAVVDTMSKDDWNNVKRGKFSDVSGTGDLTLSGSLIPSVNASKTGGFSLGSKSNRWSKLYVASTIDVSGSSLVINPSASLAAGDDFNVVVSGSINVSGSIVPGDLEGGSIGTVEAPFKDLYVQSSSIYFADMSDHGGKSWKEMTKSEKLARTTTFHKDDIDKMKRGESLNDSGHISASGNLHIVGNTTLKGETEIEGETTLKGNTTMEGYTDIQGQFRVNGTQVSNLRESLDFANSLRSKSVVSSSAQLASDISGSFTSVSSSIATNIASNTTDVSKKLGLSGGTMTGLIRGIVQSVKEAPKNETLDVRLTNVVEVNSSKAITLTILTASFPGQELTILNIGSASTTLTRATNAKTNGVYGGKNITIATGESYKLVCSSTGLWYVIS